MRNTSLIYIEQDGKYLMLHRPGRADDENRDKGIGPGGKFEPGESPEDCVRREVLEETGLTLLDQSYRAIVTFVSDEWGTEYMHLFWSDSFSGTLTECDEGKLEWVDKKAVLDLPIWEGDKIFLRLLDENIPFFSLKLCYKGDELVDVQLNGKPYEER